MKIFTKTFLYTLALLVLIALLANGLIYTLMPKLYTSQKEKTLTEQTDRFVARLEAAKRDGITDLMAEYAGTIEANLTLCIGDDCYSVLTWNGGVITAGQYAEDAEFTDVSDIKTVTTVITTDDADSAADGSVTGIVSELSGTKTIETQRSFTVEGETGTLTASLTLAPVEEAAGVIVSLLPLSILMCIVAAVVFSLLYARAITRPIKAISGETRRMTALDRDAECAVAARDEIGALAANVNSLYQTLLSTIESLEAELQKAGAAEQAKADFLRTASHELKTPVTAVSVMMDNMILGVGKYKNHEEWLPKCKELVDNLSDMLREILDASRLEDAAEDCVTESIETIGTEVLEPYAIIARAKGFNLYIDWSAAFAVTAPPKLLGKALSNIFANAVQYTAPGGRLAVYCRGRSLLVENECEPIPQEGISRLYEPFYRPDESRNRSTGGNGLGLYITDTVLRLLELDYSFMPMKSPDGMRFTITF